jgi:hypothetical protein
VSGNFNERPAFLREADTELVEKESALLGSVMRPAAQVPPKDQHLSPEAQLRGEHRGLGGLRITQRLSLSL